MPDSAPLLTRHALAPGENFLPAAARLILPFIQAPAGNGPDLGQRRLIVPGLPLASELRRELGRESGRRTGAPLFLPPCETLARWAGTVVLENLPLPESERLLLLRQALAERGWFDDGALWGVAAEMAALFDELTTHAVALPGNEEDFLTQLEAAYHLRASAPLAFEARVVHELWRVLASLGRPDAPGAYALRLARLAEAAAAPLVVILDGPPDSASVPAEREFFARYAERQPVLLLHPQHRAADPAPLARLLATAWPMADEVPPLAERAAALSAELSAELAAADATSPLSGRLAILAARGREQEARAAAATVLGWLAKGKRRIALIAQDRLVARRVRALLERREVLVADEAGWKLSTSRAGAAIDGLLETTAANVYYRDLLDLLKSPFLFDDVEEGPRKAAVFTLEQAVRDANARSGLGAMGRALEHKAPPGAAARLAGELLNRVAVAVRILSGRDTGIADWAGRLERALEAVGAVSRLGDDAAGAVILDLLARRREELGASEARFGFSVWRDWLNRELESETFRDHSIDSPVTMTHLAAARLRPFEAALILGGDAERLRPAEPPAAFFNQAVRQELGLPTRAVAQERLRQDLSLLLASVPQVVVTWQSEQEGEACLLAPELDRLSALHRFAWGDGLQGPGPRLPDPPDSDAARPGPTRQPLPSVAAAQVPARVSVSAYGTLVACPYRFFARHILGLGELEEVSEEMEKRDYGELVHKVLERFHGEFPCLAGITDADALAHLQAITEEVFAPEIADNYLALGWRLRWEKRLSPYLAWQRRWEEEGWRWERAEWPLARRLPLGDGGEVELYGRIDRADRGNDGLALLDYKTRSRTALKAHLDEDVQLAAYAVLAGGVDEVAQRAAYLALDDDKVEAVSAAEDLAAAAAAQSARLTESLAAMRAGAPLPAHGATRICDYCEMAGLCRRDYF